MMTRVRMTAALVLATAVASASAGAQVTPPDSARMADTLTRATDSIARAAMDTAITPPADQARGVDAEVRTALFELMNDRWMPAVDRLQWLNASPVAFSDSLARAGMRGREDVLFLLSQAYYRLGLSEPFRTTAQPLVQGGSTGRYATLLQSQLLMDAYRRGEHPRAMELARLLSTTTVPTGVRALASLVAGLSAYETGDYQSALTSFASAQQSGAPYGDYATYMSALTLLRTDTAQIGPAVDAMQQLAQRASGTFADQVRLTAAQLAYEAGRYDDAERLAAMVSEGGGLAAQAMFTRAWALYKADRIQQAGDAFAQFAARYPQLPEHEEGRLMGAQVMLELERTSEAASVFSAVADSVSSSIQWVRSRTPGSMTAAARQLVAQRAAGLLFIGQPSIGKTVLLQDAEGIDWSVFAGGTTGVDSVGFLPQASAPRIVGLDDVTRRVDAILGMETPLESADVPMTTGAPATTGVALSTSTPARRLFFTPASAGPNRANYVRSSQQLYQADVAFALARWRMDEALSAQARQIALLEALRASLADEEGTFGRTLNELSAARDTIAAVSTSLDRTAEWVRRMFAAQLEFTRMLATENQRIVDSVRTNLSGALQEGEAGALEYESATAQTYQRIADVLEGQIDSAIARHPAFALRDSARARADRIAALIDAARNALASARNAVDAELARLRAGDSERVMALRGALAAAEQQRAMAEAQLVAVVGAELDARASEMLANLQRDHEAAEFGAASAAFFQALEAQRAIGTTGSSSSATPTPQVRVGSSPTGTPPRQK